MATKHLLASGHTACSGCGQAAAARLVGRPLAAAAIDEAAEAAVDGALPLDENAYKVTLTRNLVRRALTSLAEEA